MVIRLADTIIQPITMMIELVAASIAFAAVLTVSLHSHIADVATIVSVFI